MTKIYKNKAEFNKREDKKINGVSEDFARENPDYEKENISNIGCWNCYNCSDEKEIKGVLEIPMIKNIHKAVLKAIKKEGCKLNMNSWHTCETTHCRAGWVVILAGEEGLKLEKETSTAFSAYQIYKASSDIKVSFNDFYVNDKKAMESIIECARLEKEKKQG